LPLRAPRISSPPGKFLLPLAFLLLAACLPPEEKILVAVDRYWSVSLKSAEEWEELKSEVERVSGLCLDISLFDSKEDGSKIEAYLDEKKPAAVFLGAFSALRLRDAAAKRPEVPFFVFDAPREGLPERSPFIWVRFSLEPAVAGLAVKIRDALEALSESSLAPRETSVLAFVDAEMDEIFMDHPAFWDISTKRVPVSSDDTVEAVRTQAGEALSGAASLYVVSAAQHSSVIIELLRQQGAPGGLILREAENLPEIPGFPVVAVLRRNYASAMKAALFSGVQAGEVLEIPLEIR
jgi:hypothetical protein